jgi:ParB family chromosome partitioning protein
MMAVKVDLASTMSETLGVGREVRADVSAQQEAALRRQAGTKKDKDALVIQHGRIVPDPDQPRREFDPEELQRLADSLKARGQLQPIRVRYDSKQDVYVIVTGERRWRAAGMAGITTMNCTLGDSDDSDEVLQDQLVENALREDLKPVEQARAFMKLMDAKGLTYRDLAKLLNISATLVCRSLKLSKLPEATQVLIDQGELAVSSAEKISELPDAGEQAALAEQVVREKIPLAQVRAEVERRKSRAGQGTQRSVPAKIEYKVGPADEQSTVRILGAAAASRAERIAALKEAIQQEDATPAQGEAA